MSSEDKVHIPKRKSDLGIVDDTDEMVLTKSQLAIIKEIASLYTPVKFIVLAICALVSFIGFGTLFKMFKFGGG